MAKQPTQSCQSERVSASEQELRMVATDSYRLSVKETQLSSPLPSAFEVNVPARALQELAGLGEQALRPDAARWAMIRATASR